MSKTENNVMDNERSRRKREYIRFAVAVGIVVLAFYFLGSLTSVFLFALLLAVLLRPAVDWFKRASWRKRGIAIGAGTLSFIGVILLFVFLAPLLMRETADFIENLPQIIDSVSKRIRSILETADRHLAWPGFDLASVYDRILASLRRNNEQVVLRGASTLFQSGLGVAGTLVGLITFPIFLIYLLLDLPHLHARLDELMPSAWEDEWNHLKRRSREIFQSYFLGMFLVSLFLAAGYSIGLSLSGIPYGLLIGLVGGLLSIVPYLGAFFAFLSALLMVVVYQLGIPELIGIGVTFAIVQFLETYIVTPKIVGSRVGLNPLVALLGVVIGGNMAGLLGMLLSIPVAALISEFIFHSRSS